jgi:hypothetical protein
MKRAITTSENSVLSRSMRESMYVVNYSDVTENTTDPLIEKPGKISTAVRYIVSESCKKEGDEIQTRDQRK